MMENKRKYLVRFFDPHPTWGGETQVIRFAKDRNEVVAWAKDEIADVRASWGIKIEILDYKGDTIWASV